MLDVPAVQVPEPLQVDAVLALLLLVPSTQAAARHTVPLAKSVQPDPSCLQLPLSPHEAWVPAVQLVAQQTLALVLVSSVTQLPVLH